MKNFLTVVFSFLSYKIDKFWKRAYYKSIKVYEGLANRIN